MYLSKRPASVVGWLVQFELRESVEDSPHDLHLHSIIPASGQEAERLQMEPTGRFCCPGRAIKPRGTDSASAGDVTLM